MLSMDFSINCAPKFFPNSDNLNTLENASAENKGLECTITYNNIKSRFLNHVFFYINFGVGELFFISCDYLLLIITSAI